MFYFPSSGPNFGRLLANNIDRDDQSKVPPEIDNTFRLLVNFTEINPTTGIRTGRFGLCWVIVTIEDINDNPIALVGNELGSDNIRFYSFVLPENR